MTTDSYSVGSKAYDLLIEPFLVRIKLLTVSILLKRFNKSDNLRFLEVACGTGTLSHLLAKKGFNVLALDQSYGMIRQAHNKIDNSCIGRVTAIHGDASTMPFFSASLPGLTAETRILSLA